MPDTCPAPHNPWILPQSCHNGRSEASPVRLLAQLGMTLRVRLLRGLAPRSDTQEVGLPNLNSPDGDACNALARLRLHRPLSDRPGTGGSAAKCDTVCASCLAASATTARTTDNDLQVHKQNSLTGIVEDI